MTIAGQDQCGSGVFVLAKGQHNLDVDEDVHDAPSTPSESKTQIHRTGHDLYHTTGP